MVAIVRTVPGAPTGAENEPSVVDAARLGSRLGSMAAVARIYDQHHRGIRQLARRLLGDDTAAEDLVQEVFEHLPRALRNFRGDAALGTFLFQIAVNRVNRHLRAAVRRRRAMRRFAEDAPVDGTDLDGDVHARELANALVAALDHLPLAQRVAFVLCEVQDLTAGEAAELAGAPEATMRTRVFHARRRLREIMRREGSP